MKTPRVYIIHGYTASSRANWFPWLKNQLEFNGIETHIPDMPFSDYPQLDLWLKCMREKAAVIDENTIFIGHSLGCITVLRFLSEKNVKIKGAILVSGFINENPMSEKTIGLQSFVEDPLDLEKLKELIPKRIAITALDDDIVPTTSTKQMAAQIEANLIELNEGKHFIDRDGHTEFPILYQEILKLFNWVDG